MDIKVNHTTQDDYARERRRKANKRKRQVQRKLLLIQKGIGILCLAMGVWCVLIDPELGNALLVYWFIGFGLIFSKEWAFGRRDDD